MSLTISLSIAAKRLRASRVVNEQAQGTRDVSITGILEIPASREDSFQLPGPLAATHAFSIVIPACRKWPLALCCFAPTS